MGELVLAALGLGLAGIDPAGALIAIAALAAGARDRAVMAVGLVSILGTARSLSFSRSCCGCW